MHVQDRLAQAARHGGQGGVDDGGVQRLHEEAGGDDPQQRALGHGIVEGG